MESNYIVSARKYRPEAFDTLIGQDNIAKTLRNSILNGQLAHAYLFCGPRGVGKTTTARIFAKMINCLNPKENLEPCGECESCKAFAEGRSFNIHELDAASNNGIDDIKALIDEVRVAPQVGRYSVFIIDEVHMLSTAAFNAFLKTLEEPPAHAIFILATTEKHKILPTILSRCQTYDFNRISVPDIVRNLRDIASREAVTIDDESLHLIARKADGAMRDALTIFDQSVAFCGKEISCKELQKNLNVLGYEVSIEMTEHFLASDYTKAMLKFDEILSSGFNALHFISSLNEHFRNLAVCKVGGMESLLELSQSTKDLYYAQADKCSLQFIYNAMGICSQCEAGYRGAVNQRLHIEFCLMRLCYLQAPPNGAATQSAAPAQTTPAAPAAQAVPAQQAPAPTPSQPAPAAAPAVQPAPAPAPQAPVRENKSPMNLGAMMGRTDSGEDSPHKLSDEIPSEEAVREKWGEFASAYKEKQRLYQTLMSAPLETAVSSDGLVVTFFTANEMNTKFIQDKFLPSMEARLQETLKSGKVHLLVDTKVMEDAPQKAYTSSEKLTEMAQENPELGTLVKNFNCTIK